MTCDTWKIKNASHKTTISLLLLLTLPPISVHFFSTVSRLHPARTSELNSRGRLNFQPLSPTVFSPLPRPTLFLGRVMYRRGTMFRKQRSGYNAPINEMIFTSFSIVNFYFFFFCREIMLLIKVDASFHVIIIASLSENSLSSIQ